IIHPAKEQVMNAITRNTKNFTMAAVAAVCLASVTIAHADDAARTGPLLAPTPQHAAEGAGAKAFADRAIFKGVRSVNAPTLTSEYDARAGVAKPINVASLR